MENVENKYTNKDVFNDPNYAKQYVKNLIDDIKNETNNTKTSLSEKIANWIDTHPMESLVLLSIVCTAISYKLYQQLLTSAIVKANKKTLNYAAKYFRIYRTEL